MSANGPISQSGPNIAFGSITRGKALKEKPLPERVADKFNDKLLAKIESLLVKTREGKRVWPWQTWGLKRALKNHYEDVSYENRRKAMEFFASLPKDKGLKWAGRILDQEDMLGLNQAARRGIIITPEAYSAAKSTSPKVAAVLLARASETEKRALAP